MKKEMKVVPIKNGTVIDHIAGGQALNVLKILGVEPGTTEEISVTMNVRSEKFGKKDVVKIEGRELNTPETDRITLIAPNATINIIRDSEISEKHKVKLPKTIEGILKCPNPNCISNVPGEHLMSRFITVSENPPLFRCFFCERMIEDVSGWINKPKSDDPEKKEKKENLPPGPGGLLFFSQLSDDILYVKIIFRDTINFIFIMKKDFNIVIVGTGGQGLITLLQILAEAASLEDYDVKTSELHGLSQRGGSVEVHIRMGKRVYSPLVAQGKANLILGLEMQEALKGSYYASQKTSFLVNQFIRPIPLVKNLTEKEISNNLEKISRNVNIVPAEKICQEKLGNSVVAGIYLISLAVFKKLLPLNLNSIKGAIKKIIPEKYLELNLKAFDLARLGQS